MVGHTPRFYEPDSGSDNLLSRVQRSLSRPRELTRSVRSTALSGNAIFTLEGNKGTHEIEVSWNQAWALTRTRTLYFRFQGIADMAELAGGSTRSRMTRTGHGIAPVDVELGKEALPALSR